MKSKMLTTVAIALLIINAGFAQVKGKWTEAQASSFIKYGNQLVDYFNRNAAMATNIKSARSTYEDNKQKVGVNKDATLYHMSCNYYLNLNNKNITPAAPANYPDKTVAQTFKNCEALFKRIQGTCESIGDYFSKKTYTTDNFSKSDQLMQTMEMQWDSAYMQMKQAVNKASKVSSEAELVFLQKSPIKNFVIPMKQDLGSFKDFLDELEENPADLTSVKQKLSEIKNIYEKNKVMEGKDFTKMDSYYRTDVYPNFYKGLLEATSAAEGYIKKAEEVTKATDKSRQNELIEYQRQYQNSIYSNYNKAIDNYNTFIKQ